MSRFAATKWWQVLALLAVLELLTVGAGMGVPVFAILLGFPVGWFAARRYLGAQGLTAGALRRALAAGATASSITFVLMLAIWGPKFALLSQPGFDAGKWGIPLILYGSTASFLGWQALMIAISPLLQLAASTFATYVVAARGRYPVAEPQDVQNR